MKKLYDAIKAVDSDKRFAIMPRHLSCNTDVAEIGPHGLDGRIISVRFSFNADMCAPHDAPLHKIENNLKQSLCHYIAGDSLQLLRDLELAMYEGGIQHSDRAWQALDNLAKSLTP